MQKPVRITFVSRRARLLDLDNLCEKAVIDGLVMAGLLPKDDPGGVKSITHVQEKGRSESTILIIEED